MLKTRCFILGLCLLLLASFFAPVPVSAATVNTIQGVIGSTVTVSGLSYPSQTYLIIWDSVSYDSGIVPATGIISFTVPESVGGSHTLVIQNPAGTQAYTSTFTVLPSILISPETAIVGSTVTVTGKGFRASETDIVVLYDGESQKSAITASATGTWTTTISIPQSISGSHTIDAYGSVTLATSVTDKTFTVKPGIVITPVSGGVGTNVTVTGTGFPADATGVAVYFDSDTVRSGLTADSKGTWTTTFVIPKTHSGNHIVDAYSDTVSLSTITDQTFAVMSGITVDKTSAYVGDVIVVTGTGFDTNEPNIYLTYDGINQGSAMTADSTGQWKTNFSVPASVNGTHTIGVNAASSSVSSSNTITVLSRITLNPTSGNVGDSISVAGTGFAGGKALTITYGTATVVSNITTDSTGGFTTSFKAPKGQKGNITITATDADSVKATAVFSMDTTPPSTPQTINPARGSMVGFVGNIKVNFKWRDVTDPSGITYDVQVADDIAFNNVILQYSDLAISEYKTTESEALPQGDYYWRVRATDGAGNVSEWSSAVQFTAGFMSTSTLIIILVVLIVVLVILLRIRAVFSKK